MIRLEDVTVIRAPIERCFDLARSIEAHLAGNVHSGESAMATGGVTSGLIGQGQRVTWRAKHFGVWQTLSSEITAIDRPTYFQDTMIRGAFAHLQHDHFFAAVTPQETQMRDVFCFAAPIPLLGRIAEIVVLRRYMRTLLRERNAGLKDIAESSAWQRYLRP